jgi:hypothetical protein
MTESPLRFSVLFLASFGLDTQQLLEIPGNIILLTLVYLLFYQHPGIILSCASITPFQCGGQSL